MGANSKNQRNAYAQLTPEQQMLVMEWVAKQKRDANSKYYEMPIRDLCHSIAVNEKAIKQLEDGNEPFAKPKSKNRNAPPVEKLSASKTDPNDVLRFLTAEQHEEFIRTTVRDTMDSFLERLASGKIQPQGKGPRTRG